MTEPAVLLIRRRRPIGEPGGLRPVGDAGVATLEGTAGAGRIVLAMTEAGVPCTELTQAVIPAHIELAELDALDLGRFDTVVLGSHLVNLPDDDRRRAFLAMAARHLAPGPLPEGGAIYLEHHPIDWAETAADVEPTPGSSVGMEEVRRHAPFVSAVSVYDVGGRVERQPFTARVLSDAELAADVSTLGLEVTRRLGPTWIEARRVRPPAGA